MSIHNLISYLTGWGELVLKWIALNDNKKEIIFPEDGYQWNQLGSLAQKFYVDYQDLSFKDLKIKLDNTKKLIIEIIESMNNQQLYHEGFYNKYPLGRMIQLNTSSPYKNAKARIRKWKKEKNK